MTITLTCYRILKMATTNCSIKWSIREDRKHDTPMPDRHRLLESSITSTDMLPLYKERSADWGKESSLDWGTLYILRMSVNTRTLSL